MSDTSFDEEPEKSEKNRNYEVGYCRPPKQHQFRKGEPSPRRGKRGKGSRGLRTALQSAINERVAINENGKKKTLTKLEVTLKQVVNKAAGGDLKAAERVLELILRVLGSDGETDVRKDTNVEGDDDLLSEFLERMTRGRTHQKEPDDEPAAE